MNGVILVETLRRSWKSLLGWSFSMGLIGYYLMIVVPNMDVLQQYSKLISSMPSALFSLMGVDDTAVVATPEGFISFGFFSYATLMLAVWAVMAGMSISANEEDEGILDVVLALPVPRWPAEATDAVTGSKTRPGAAAGSSTVNDQRCSCQSNTVPSSIDSIPTVIPYSPPSRGTSENANSTAPVPASIRVGSPDNLVFVPNTWVPVSSSMEIPTWTPSVASAASAPVSSVSAARPLRSLCGWILTCPSLPTRYTSPRAPKRKSAISADMLLRL